MEFSQGSLLVLFTVLTPALTGPPPGCPASLSNYNSVFAVHKGVCYMFELERRTNYATAQLRCEHLGGTLALVKSQVVSDYLTDVLRDKQDQYNVERVWIGLSDRDTESTFLWEDGTPLQWTNWMEPNHGKNDDFKDCVYMNQWRDYQWYVQTCTGHDMDDWKAYVCQFDASVPAMPGSTVSSPGDVSTSADPHPSCPSGLHSSKDTFLRQHGDVCYLFDLNTKRHYDDAERRCEQLGGTLVLVKTQDVEDFLYSVLVEKEDDTTAGVWIGLSDRDIEQTFAWEDGEPLHWTHWAGRGLDLAGNDPVNDCVYMYPRDHNTWYAETCASTQPDEQKLSICQFDQRSSSAAAVTSRPTALTTAGIAASATTTTTTTATPPGLPHCPPFKCDVDCGLDGYQVDAEGCSVCQCNS